MQVKWTSKALGDLARLHAFLADVSPQAAAKSVVTITEAVAMCFTFFASGALAKADDRAANLADHDLAGFKRKCHLAPGQQRSFRLISFD